MREILINNGPYEIALDEKEVSKLYCENLLLKDILLLILNQDVADKNWDIHLTYEEALKEAYSIYLNSNYNQEFIKSIFAKYSNIS